MLDGLINQLLGLLRLDREAGPEDDREAGPAADREAVRAYESALGTFN